MLPSKYKGVVASLTHTSTIQRERLLEQRLKAAGDMEPLVKSGLGQIAGGLVD